MLPYGLTQPCCYYYTLVVIVIKIYNYKYYLILSFGGDTKPFSHFSPYTLSSTPHFDFPSFPSFGFFFRFLQCISLSNYSSPCVRLSSRCFSLSVFFNSRWFLLFGVSPSRESLSFLVWFFLLLCVFFVVLLCGH